VKFTDTSIRALRANGSRYEKFEDGKPGFGIRVSEHGRKTWVYLYRYQGTPRRLTLGVYSTGASPSEPVVMSLARAHSAWARAREALSEGKDPGADAVSAREAARSAPDMARLGKEYIERHAKAKKRSWKEDERILATYVEPKWKHRKAAEITKRDVVLLLDDIAAHGAPSRPERERRPAPIMANRVRSLLSRLFRFAVARHVIDTSPVFGVEKPADERRRTRLLSADEIRTFWRNAEDKKSGLSKTFAIALKILLVTGQRKGELAAAQWSDIDLASAVWTIPDAVAKNKRTHLVPLSPLAVKLLEELRATTVGTPEDDLQNEGQTCIGPVLPSRLVRGGTISANALDRSLRRAIDKSESPESPLAAMTPFTPHDLRRTAATGLGELGFDDFTIGLVLNHTSRGITGRYNLAQYEAQKRHALDAWAQRVESIVEQVPDNVVRIVSHSGGTPTRNGRRSAGASA
jgi:integrase